MAKEAFVFTHMLGRYLDDFGNVVRYLDGDGYKVTIYASVPRRSERLSIDSESVFESYRSALPPSIEVKPFPYVRDLRMKPWDPFKLMVFGFRLGRRHPDAVFMTWSVYLIIVCGLPLRLLNRRTVAFITGLGPVLGSTGSRFRFFRGLIVASYAYLMSGRNSRALNHNHEDKVFLAQRLHARSEKFFVAPGCGVDPEVFPFFEERSGNPVPVILVPARLIEDKGIKEAVAASAVLCDRGVAHEMWFTGAAEPYPWISLTEHDIEQAQESNSSVRFIGYQPSMVPVYRRADIVCYPTRYPEGTPTGLIEAAATGRPSVTCDTVGAREIVVDGVTGFVVPQRDPVALADALQCLIEDGDRYERFKRAAHEHFLAHYTKDMALLVMLECLESLGLVFDRERTAPDIRRPA